MTCIEIVILVQIGGTGFIRLCYDSVSRSSKFRLDASFLIITGSSVLTRSRVGKSVGKNSETFPMKANDGKVLL